MTWYHLVSSAYMMSIGKESVRMRFLSIHFRSFITNSRNMLKSVGESLNPLGTALNLNVSGTFEIRTDVI